MIGLDDLEDGSRQELLPPQNRVEEREEEEDDEGDHTTTLLNGSHERTRGRERSAGVVQRFWPQVKDIVIEVRVKLNFETFFFTHRDPDRPDPALHHRRSAVHGRVAGQGFRK